MNKLWLVWVVFVIFFASCAGPKPPTTSVTGCSQAVGANSNNISIIPIIQTAHELNNPILTNETDLPEEIPGKYIATVIDNSNMNQTESVLLKTKNTSVLEIKAENAEEVRKLPYVIDVQPVYKYQLLASINDTYCKTPYIEGKPETQQWYLDHIAMPAAGDKISGNATVKVAVVDDGYQLHSADLPSGVWDLTPVSGSCVGSTFVNCLNTADNSNNSAYIGTGSSHGTQVAGVMAALTNNGKGIAGVGWNTIQIVPINVFGKAGGTTTSIVKGIRTAIAKGVKVINLSLCLQSSNGHCSGTTDAVIEAALKEATDAGITIVASGGNYGDNFVAYPAVSQYALAVGWTDIDKKRSTQANYGRGLDIMAPGKSVLLVASGNSWEVASGSSFSSPMVAGAAALLYGKKTNATRNQVVNALLGTAQSLGYVCEYGKGMLQMDKALDAIASAATTTPEEACMPLTGKVELFKAGQGQALSSVSKGPEAFASRYSMDYSFKSLTEGSYTLKASLYNTSSPSTILSSCQKDITLSQNATALNLNAQQSSSFPSCL